MTDPRSFNSVATYIYEYSNEDVHNSGYLRDSGSVHNDFWCKNC